MSVLSLARFLSIIRSGVSLGVEIWLLAADSKLGLLNFINSMKLKLEFLNISIFDSGSAETLEFSLL